MSPTLSLNRRATRDLDFIRRTMERATEFTAVPGKGLVVTGVIAFATAALASRTASGETWLATWLVAAAASCATGVTAMVLKARRAGIALLSGPGRRFLVALLPPFAAGGILTFVLAGAGLHQLLPGMWLLLYGVGVLTGGAFAIRPVVVMGGCFFALGVAALLAPAYGREAMVAGFGAVQIVFGGIIARRYGG